LASFLVLALGSWAQAQDKAVSPPAKAEGTIFANPIAKPTPPYRSVKEIKKPQRWDESDQKVEIVYFFWYGCPTCKAIDGIITELTANLPEGIRFKRVPAAFRENSEWSAHATLFWALENMGVEEKLHEAVFKAVQPGEEIGHGPVQLLSPDSQKAFAKANKLDAKEFAQRLTEPLNGNALQKTYSYLDKVEMESVPAFVVNGRYVVSIEGRRPISDFPNQALWLAFEELAKAKAGTAQAETKTQDQAK
jgi:thiol:disulfide interchange protein DsbA